MADPISLVVAPIVSKLIEIAIELLKEEIILLTGVGAEIQKLRGVLHKINTILHDAEDKQISSSSSRELKLWLKNLRDVAHDAEDTLDLFASKAHKWKQGNKSNDDISVNELVKIQLYQHTTQFESDFQNQVRKWFQHTAAETIRELLKRFETINLEKDSYNLKANAGGNLFENRPETGHSLKSEVVGREIGKEAIIKALLTKSSHSSNDIDVISIVGIGGTGKTTLAQLVINDERISKEFHIYRMWVCVNVNFELARILREMIRYHSKMKHGDHNLSRSQLESRVEAFLPNNRFLLVLDDVWTEDADDWDSLKGLLNLGAPGSRVLVTTRNTNVARMMGTGPEPHRLSDLTDEESWQLFCKCAFLNGHIPQDLEDIGRKIVRKCNGLPLATKAMAGLLRGNLDVNKWNRILKNEIWELEEQNSKIKNLKVLPALKFSFNYLPSELKQCFLFCSIFPKAHSFVKSELVKIWMAEGFIAPRNSETLEDTGNSYFDELLSRSFFIFSDVSREEAYRMHDLIHDLALSISGPDYYQVMTETSCETKENSRHVSLLCEDVAKPTSDLIANGKKVRTVLLRGVNIGSNEKMLDRLFNSLKYIRVLDLSSSSIDVLPDSIEELQLLRYLDLSKTEIKMLPNSICNLWNLQTLRLLRCLWLCELPKGFAKLTSLRHLELDDMFWHKLTRLPAGAGCIRNLHNLQKFWVAPDKGYRVEELQDLKSLTGTLHLLRLENALNARDTKLNEKTNLLKVVLEWSKNDDGDPINQECTLHDLQPQSELQELQIIHFSGSKFPAWMSDGSLKKLTRVSLNNCINCKTLSLEQLPKLICLSLKGMHNLEECHGAQWPSLRILRISGCPKLRVLPDVMFNLYVLKIKKCNLLKILPVTPSLSFLTLADNAILEDWNEVEVHFKFQDDQGHEKTDCQPSLAMLLDVKIIRCPMLKLPNNFSPRKLDISECDQLKQPPPLRNSENLKHLSLDNSIEGTLLSLIPNCTSLDTLVISNISTLSYFPKLPSIPGLKALYIRGWVDLEHIHEELNNQLTSLKFLSIQDCPKLKTLPSSIFPTTLECLSIGSCNGLTKLEMVKASMTSLKDIDIQNCESLECMPEDGFPDSVRHLKIHGCQLVAERCRKGDGPDWSKISHVPDLEVETTCNSTRDVSNRLQEKQASSSSNSNTWFKKMARVGRK